MEDAAAGAPDAVVARLAAVDASFAELREALLATEHVSPTTTAYLTGLRSADRVRSRTSANRPRRG